MQIKRIYETPLAEDGYRILVDRLWPRGISKDFAALDEWNKTITPSTELRKWFDHRADRFLEFSRLYKAELANQEEELIRLKAITESQNLTLLYAAKDKKINHAVILLKVLQTI